MARRNRNRESRRGPRESAGRSISFPALQTSFDRLGSVEHQLTYLAALGDKTRDVTYEANDQIKAALGKIGQLEADVFAAIRAALVPVFEQLAGQESEILTGLERLGGVSGQLGPEVRRVSTAAQRDILQARCVLAQPAYRAPEPLNIQG